MVGMLAWTQIETGRSRGSGVCLLWTQTDFGNCLLNATSVVRKLGHA